MKKVIILLSVALFLFFSWELSFAQLSSSEIEAIQKAIKEKGLSWTAGETDITNMTDEEKNAMLGGIKMPPGSPDRPRPGSEGLDQRGLLSYFSWGSYGGHNWMTSVKNQGGCGSCWGFAAAGMFESRQKIELNQYYREPDVSEQKMVSCWKGNCGGATMPWTLGNFQSDGVPDDDCFPYVSGSGYVPPCSDTCDDCFSRQVYFENWGWWSSPSNTTIKNEVQNNGPVTVWMEIYTDFDAYTGGVFVHTTGTSRGGHFVVIYGWDDGNNCWLCKNSWGTGWGETGPDGTLGWFRIQMGGANCGHAAEAHWGDPGPLPNLVHTDPSGWSYAVVPRNVNNSTETWVPISSTLPGNSSNTYLNWAYTNNGSATAWDIYGRVFIDSEWYAWWHSLTWANPGWVEKRFINKGPLTIRGGRHTICDSLDWDNTVFESYEYDNNYTRQFVWSPYLLAENTPVYRSAPPWKGYLTYPNSDGFQFTRPGNAFGVGTIPSNSADDYDVYLYSNYSGSESGFSSLLQSSGWGDGYTDFVVGSYNSSPSTTYPAIVRYGPDHNSGVRIDATSSSGRITSSFPKTWSGESLPAYRVLNVYEVLLDNGVEYGFELDNTSGNANLVLALYPSSVGFYHKSGYKHYENGSGAGGDEWFSWIADADGWFPLVVFKNNYADYSDANIYDLMVYEWPLCGDVNGDWKIDLSDVIHLANFYLSGGDPIPIPKFRANANGDNKINLSDVIHIANYKLKGGPAPHDCENYGH